MGKQVVAYDGADGDGSTWIDDADYSIWKAGFGDSLPEEAGEGGVAELNVEVLEPRPEAELGPSRQSGEARPQLVRWYFAVARSHSANGVFPGSSFDLGAASDPTSNAPAEWQGEPSTPINIRQGTKLLTDDIAVDGDLTTEAVWSEREADSEIGELRFAAMEESLALWGSPSAQITFDEPSHR
jgi:hypothetical protein